MALRGGYSVRQIQSSPYERTTEYLWEGKVIRRYVDPLALPGQEFERGTRRNQNKNLMSVMQPMPPVVSNSLNTHTPASGVLSDLVDGDVTQIALDKSTGGGNGPTAIPVSPGAGGPPGSGAAEDSAAPAGPVAPGTAASGTSTAASSVSDPNVPQIGCQDITGRLDVVQPDTGTNDPQAPKTAAPPPVPLGGSLSTIVSRGHDSAFQTSIGLATDVSAWTAEQASNAGVKVDVPPTPAAPGFSFEGSAAVPPASTASMIGRMLDAAFEDLEEPAADATNSFEAEMDELATHHTSLSSNGVRRRLRALSESPERAAVPAVPEGVPGTYPGTSRGPVTEPVVVPPAAVPERPAHVPGPWQHMAGMNIGGGGPRGQYHVGLHAGEDSIEAEYLALAVAHGLSLGNQRGGNPDYSWAPGRVVGGARYAQAQEAPAPAPAIAVTVPQVQRAAAVDGGGPVRRAVGWAPTPVTAPLGFRPTDVQRSRFFNTPSRAQLEALGVEPMEEDEEEEEEDELMPPAPPAKRPVTGIHHFNKPKPPGWNKSGRKKQAHIEPMSGVVRGPTESQDIADAHAEYKNLLDKRRLLKARVVRAQKLYGGNKDLEEELEEMNGRVERAKAHWMGLKGKKDPRNQRRKL